MKNRFIWTENLPVKIRYIVKNNKNRDRVTNLGSKTGSIVILEKTIRIKLMIYRGMYFLSISFITNVKITN